MGAFAASKKGRTAAKQQHAATKKEKAVRLAFFCFSFSGDNLAMAE